jgi:hypothetical protein
VTFYLSCQIRFKPLQFNVRTAWNEHRYYGGASICLDVVEMILLDYYEILYLEYLIPFSVQYNPYI